MYEVLLSYSQQIASFTLKKAIAHHIINKILNSYLIDPLKAIQRKPNLPTEILKRKEN